MESNLPAGAGEKMQYIVHPFNDNTLRFVLRYPRLLREDWLQAATFALVQSVDVLHASFVADNRTACWQVNDVTPDQCFTCLQVQGDPLETALTCGLTPIHPDDPVQLRCFLVQGTASCAVTLLISHLCADGRDGLYLLQKLCEAYNLLAHTGSCSGLSVKNGSRAVEQVYAHLSRMDRLKLMRDPRTGVKSSFPFPTDEEGSPAVLRLLVPQATMAAAHTRCKAAGVTVNDLLLTACYYAYVETTHADASAPVSIMAMMDLRRHCDGHDSEGLCNLTGALSTALPAGLGSTFSDTLAEIAAQTRRNKEDPFAGLYGMPLLHGAANKLPLKLLLSVSNRVYGSMAVGMTNIGSIDGAALSLEGMHPDEGWFGGPVKRKPGVQVSVASFDGACSLALWGYAAEKDRPRLQQLLDCIGRHLRDYAASID